MNSRHLMFAVLVLAFASALAVPAQQSASAGAEPRNDSVRKQHARPRNEGEQLFQQHCSRCHAAPDGFSPRISGTIVRHMRVRASLSQHEEEELRRFFNP